MLTNTNTAVATETLRHLGAYKALVMMGATGVRAVSVCEDGVTIAIKGSHRGNRLVIRLDHETDLYTVQVWSVRGAKVAQRSEVTHVSAEGLRSAVETSLRLSL